MRNFHLLGTGLDMAPLMNALHRQPELWNQHTFRTTYPKSPHSEVDDIWLRFQQDPEDFEHVLNGHESVNYPALQKLPLARVPIFWLMARVEGERLGRVMITRLAPGAKIGAHADGGEHAAYYDRFHIVLKGLAGSSFVCGGEQVNMQTGEVWWFDNKQVHSVANNASDDRVHMVIDIRTYRDADDAG